MFVPIDDYLSRIYDTLENVVAPEIESDFARGQVFAAIALLSSLSKKIEYKRELILAEVNAGTEIISVIIKVLNGAGITPPAETASFMSELEKNGPEPDTRFIIRVNDNFRLALDCFDQNRKKIKEDAWTDADRQIRKYIDDITLRDVGFMATTSFDKILRSEKKAK